MRKPKFDETKDILFSLNLEKSGYCAFNCPACFAKELIVKNGGKLGVNCLSRNSKMLKGKTTKTDKPLYKYIQGFSVNVIRRVLKHYRNIFIRVGVLNNFNKTKKEYMQLLDVYRNLTKAERKRVFIFTNSNCHTKNTELSGIKCFPETQTLNPNLTDFKTSNLNINTKVVRFKFATFKNKKLTGTLIGQFKEFKRTHPNIEVLVTFFRFRKKRYLKELNLCSDSYEYKKENHTYKIKEWYREVFINLFEEIGFHICDKKKNGCLDCLNCVKLNFGV